MMNKIGVIFLSVSLCLLFATGSFSAALTMEELVDKLQANQDKIKDMYAETTTTITSSIAMPGSQAKGPQKMIQKGKMWTKGKDKSKIEMTSPMKQITITNGDQMAIINPQTGQKMVQDLTKMRNQGIQGSRDQGMDLEKAMEYFDLSVKKLDASVPRSLETYVITGVPKESNQFLTKMEFYIDAERWVPVKILMYGARNKLMSRSEIEYVKFPTQSSDLSAEVRSAKVEAFSEGGWVPVKNVSNVNTPMGRMEIEMIFENIKVNEGIGDEEFEIN